MNAMEMVDNALAFAPDRMMRSFEIKLPEAAQDYYGVENKLNEEEYIRDAAELASKRSSRYWAKTNVPLRLQTEHIIFP